LCYMHVSYMHVRVPRPAISLAQLYQPDCTPMLTRIY
jgi:hypothetical protein